MILKFRVREQTIRLQSTKAEPRQGSKEYLELQFSFSSAWNDLLKYVYIQHGEVSVPHDLADGPVIVDEYFTEQTEFNVTLFGRSADGSVEVPTNVITVFLKESNNLWEKDAPEPQNSWFVQVVDARDEALAAAIRAENAAIHQPYPNSETGTWFVWNAETGQYEDTGKVTKGDKGDTGPAGPKGDTGEQGLKGEKGDPGDTPDMTAYRTAEAQDVIDAGKQNTLIQSGATVGQIAKITAVDDNGKPTAWQAVDMPSGGGGHWETVLDTVWQQDVINPTAYDSETGIFTCAAWELDNLELNTEYAFFPQCTKEGVAYNTILSNELVKVTKLSETTFSIDVTPPTTFVPTNVKFSRGAVLAITDIDAKKIRLTLDGQFKPTATLYDRPFYGMSAPYFGGNTGYVQIRIAYQAYQQVTAEVESPYRIVGKILCGFNAPSNSGNFHFKNNSFCCPLVPYDVPEGNERKYLLTSDGTKIAKLYSTSSPWHFGGVNEFTAILNDYLRIISGTKVKLERWVE